MNGAPAQVDPQAFAFITLVNDEAQYQTCLEHIRALKVPEGYRLDTVKITGAKSMATGYNQAMSQTNAKYKVYLHQDTFVLHRDFLGNLLSLFNHYPRLGMLGVVGATRLPANGVWFVNNPFHCVGEVLEFRRSGGIKRMLGPLNRRKERLMRFRSVNTDYVPVLVVDGLAMVTQYDLPWGTDPDYGFLYYEGPQCLEYIRHGYEVGVPKQTAPWFLHYGPTVERNREHHMRTWQQIWEHARWFRNQYAEFIDVPVETVLQRYRSCGE